MTQELTIQDRLLAARADFAAVVGEEHVLDEATSQEQFNDPYDSKVRPRSRTRYVVQPGSVEEVQGALAVANRHEVPLWVGSQGRNNGYGGAAAVQEESVNLNLRRMNRVLEVNEEFGYAVVEPGVSFAELHAYIREHDYDVWTDVPDLSWGSVIGNTLDHGVGYTPFGEHADQVCGMEIVLPDGDLVRTGMGAQANSKTAHTHQRGFGPRMDEMFMQSNFGVVTKMGVWLMRRPKRWRAVWVHVEDNEGCYQLIDALRPLILDGIVRNRVTIMSLLAMATALSQKSQWQEDTGPVTPEVRAKMREAFGLGEWNARIGLYGEPDRMDIDQRLVEEAVADIPGVRVVSREYAGDASAEEVFPPDQAMAGIPNMDLLRMLDWYGHDRPGHVAYAPIEPQTGDDGRVLHDLVTHYANDGMGQDFGEAFYLTGRTMQLLG